MRFLHILNANERNSANLIRQLKATVDLTNHVFLVLNSEEKVKKLFPEFHSLYNFEYLPAKGRLKKIACLYKRMADADKIIFHSLIFNSNKFLLFFAVLKKFLKKSVWIEWGGDLYNWKREETDLKSRVLNYLNHKIRAEIPVVGTTFEYDNIAIKRDFGDKRIYFTPLPFGTDRMDLLKEVCTHHKRTDGPVRIQVAHNILPINNHLSILEKLEKFKLKNIRIIMPISYGTFGIGGKFAGLTYKRNVQICAKNMFPENITFMSKGIALKYYLRYLWNIDIAVFDCDRPIALANIYYLYFLGKKIFVPRKSPQYSFFIDQGMRIFATEDISKMSFEEFVSNDLKPLYDPNNPDMKLPPILEQKFKPYEEMKYWKIFFEELSK